MLIPSTEMAKRGGKVTDQGGGREKVRVLLQGARIDGLLAQNQRPEITGQTSERRGKTLEKRAQWRASRREISRIVLL